MEWYLQNIKFFSSSYSSFCHDVFIIIDLLVLCTWTLNVCSLPLCCVRTNYLTSDLLLISTLLRTIQLSIGFWLLGGFSQWRCQQQVIGRGREMLGYLFPWLFSLWVLWFGSDALPNITGPIRKIALLSYLSRFLQLPPPPLTLYTSG